MYVTVIIILSIAKLSRIVVEQCNIKLKELTYIENRFSLMF